MKEQLKKTLVRLLLSLGFSSLLLVVLLCGLSQTIEAGARVASATTAREKNRPGLVDYQTGVSVCEQTENRVHNPGFEDGIGWPNHWYEGGNGCTYGTYEPGHDSATSAMILSGSAITDRCMLFTSIDEIPVEPGKFYDYSAWMKATLLEGEAYLRIEFWSHQGDPPVWKWEGEGRTNSVTDTHGKWVQVTGSVQVPADAEYARVEPTLPCPSAGVVWFDDIFLGLATCLDISKSDDPDPVEPGQMLTHTIVCSNTGRESATDVEIIETYDHPYVVFESAQPPPSASTNIWEIPELLPGDSGTITVRVQVAGDTGDRTSLINGVLICSDETVEPIYTVITTTITPTNGCAIALYLPDAEKTVEPGHWADYDLNLYNAGSYDGQSDLVATSSQGWEVIIIPPPPYTMPSSSLEAVAVSLIVPDHALSGTVDVTTITATLECEPPCNETVTETTTITTTVTAIPLTEVVIAGPTGGNINTPYTFTTTFSPPAATLPIAYTWSPTPAMGQGSAVVTYTWSTTGAHIITVTATNGGKPVSATHSISIEWHKVHLPLVLRNCPSFWEREPNNSCLQANGPLISGADYYGYHDDDWDCFSIYLSTVGQVSIALTTGIDQGVQLQLCDQECNPLAYVWQPPYHIEYTGPAGWYYICIYTESGYNTDTPYTLRATFP